MAENPGGERRSGTGAYFYRMMEERRNGTEEVSARGERRRGKDDRVMEERRNGDEEEDASGILV